MGFTPVRGGSSINGIAKIFYSAVVYHESKLKWTWIYDATALSFRISWSLSLFRFAIFFPLRKPVCIQPGSTLEVHFWRCCGSTKVKYHNYCFLQFIGCNLFSIFTIMFYLLYSNVQVGKARLILLFECVDQVWYEWCVASPYPSPIHNSNGRSYWVGL